MKEYRILIGDDRILVVGPDGSEHQFAGVALFAGDGFIGESLIVAEGCSADAAMAFVRGYGMPAMEKFYESAALHFMQALGPEKFVEFSRGEEIAERWEKENEGKGH